MLWQHRLLQKLGTEASGTHTTLLAGVLSLIFGAIVCCYSIINLGRSFSPLITPRKSNAIVKTGMYQYMRHPLYAGLIMLAFGLSAVFYDEGRFMLSCLLALVVVRYRLPPCSTRFCHSVSLCV